MDVDDTPPSTKRRAAPKVLDSKTFKDGAIYLYRRAEYKKPTWFIRLKIPGAKGYVWQSSKTTDEYEAYKAAEDLYNQSLVRVLGGGKLHSKRISDGLKAYVTHLEPDRERLSIHYKILLAERLIPVFHGKTFDEVLSFSLQMFPSGESFGQAAKNDKQAGEIKKFIEDCRSMLSTEVLVSGQFAFKAFLIQVGNHQSADALPIQFLQHDKMDDEQREQFDKFAVAVKWKTVRVANDNLMKPKDVIQRVARATKRPFSQYDHRMAWKRHKVRPDGKSSTPEITDSKFCVYDALGKGYGYTEAWVHLLIDEINNANAPANPPQPVESPT